jgi:hypothetical protein
MFTHKKNNFLRWIACNQEDLAGDVVDIDSMVMVVVGWLVICKVGGL